MLLNISLQRTSDQLHNSPLIFLHGVFGQGKNFRSFQQYFAKNREVGTIDLRNHGKSLHGAVTYPIMAQDLFDTLHHDNLTPAIIAGHSMGGKTAMCFALQHPHDVKALIVIDIPPAPTKKSSLGISKDIRNITFPDSLTLKEVDQLLKSYIPQEAVRQIMIQNIARGTHPHWKIGINEIFDHFSTIMGWPYQWAKGKHYPGPTLFIKGEHSPYLRAEHENEIKKLFPHAKHVTLPQSGHWVHAQNPQDFRECLEQFLNVID